MKINLALTLDKKQAQAFMDLLDVTLTSSGEQTIVLAEALKTTVDETKRTNIKNYLDTLATQHAICSEMYEMLLTAKPAPVLI